MVNKSSTFVDFVRFRPNTYARTQQSLPSLWAAIISSLLNINTILFIRFLE